MDGRTEGSIDPAANLQGKHWCFTTTNHSITPQRVGSCRCAISTQRSGLGINIDTGLQWKLGVLRPACVQDRGSPHINMYSNKSLDGFLADGALPIICPMPCPQGTTPAGTVGEQHVLQQTHMENQPSPWFTGICTRIRDHSWLITHLHALNSEGRVWWWEMVAVQGERLGKSPGNVSEGRSRLYGHTGNI